MSLIRRFPTLRAGFFSLPALGWIVLVAFADPASSAIFADRLETPAPSFYDLNQLWITVTPEEWAANRYGRRIRATSFQFRVYLNDAGEADTNVRPDAVDCICPGGNCVNGTIPAIGNQFYDEGDPCHTGAIDYSQVLFFDYNDPQPGAQSFDKSAAALISANPTADPVLGTLLSLRMEPAPIAWTIRYPSGMGLLGSRQFNPTSCPMIGTIDEDKCGLFFRQIVIYKMGVDSPDQLIVFLPSVIDKNFTDPPPDILGGVTQYSGFKLGGQDFDSPDGLPNDKIYRPELQPEHNVLYQAPLCMDILSSLNPSIWQSRNEIRVYPFFDIDPTRTPDPKYPEVNSFSVSQLNSQQSPPAELQRDFSYRIESSPLWVHPGPLDEGLTDVLFPLGAVTLTEERVGYLGPPNRPFDVIDPPMTLSVDTELTIQSLLPEVTFASHLMTPKANGYIHLQSPLAGFAAQANADTFLFQDNLLTAQIRVRNPQQPGELGFHSALIRVPRSKVRQLSEADPANGGNCLYFDITITHFSSDCLAIDRETKTVPLVCVNPSEFKSSVLKTR